MRAFGGRGDGPGQFQKPFGACVGPDGEIFVSDWGRNDVQVFQEDGTLVGRIGGGGEGGIVLEQPTGLAVDGDGRLFVGCFGSSRVQIVEES